MELLQVGGRQRGPNSDVPKSDAVVAHELRAHRISTWPQQAESVEVVRRMTRGTAREATSSLKAVQDGAGGEEKEPAQVG